jgi:hypothetical protein
MAILSVIQDQNHDFLDQPGNLPLPKCVITDAVVFNSSDQQIISTRASPSSAWDSKFNNADGFGGDKKDYQHLHLPPEITG